MTAPVPFDEAVVRGALRKAWSLESARQYTPQCPEAGQCNVTAVVVQDLFGGTIECTTLPGFDVPHFYNRINGRRVDLTDGQFASPVSYDDQETTREHAMNWVLESELVSLQNRLTQALTQVSR